MTTSAPPDRAREPGPAGPAISWRPSEFRIGWLLGGVWLFFLWDPLNVLLHVAGWRRYLGLVALVAFGALYLYVVAIGRRAFRGQHVLPLAGRWAMLLGLGGLVALMIPGAGRHAFATGGYLAAAAMMALPIAQAVAVCAVLGIGTETLVRLVPGWSGGGGAGLAVVLAGAAVLGLRLAFDRNKRLVEAQHELSQLAVEHERARIASDLHDILGHSLTVVAVKAELAQRLLDTDPARARSELRDVEMLARDALADVRATTQGVRGVSLPGEIAAAKSALAAADITAELPTAADEVAGRWRELFAWTIREAVTNVVRHSKAANCVITLTPSSVEIVDDGRGCAGATGGGQGLAGLGRRADALGARLTTGNRDGTPGFTVRMEAA